MAAKNNPSPADSGVAVVILAAGLGTRMKSNRAKVLHELSGKPMILHVVETACRAGAQQVVIVVGHQAEEVEKVVGQTYAADYALQAQQLGTGHAVSCCLPAVSAEIKDVVILCGDVPLLQPETITRMIDIHRRNQRKLTVLGVRLEDPTGYGRLLFDDQENVIGIVEEADADAQQKQINTVNAGIYCVERNFLQQALLQIDDNNAQGEIYLTDIVAVGHAQRQSMGTLIGADADEVIGVNSQQDLAHAQQLLNRRMGKYA